MGDYDPAKDTLRSSFFRVRSSCEIVADLIVEFPEVALILWPVERIKREVDFPRSLLAM